MPDEIDRINDMTERQMANAMQRRERELARRAPGLTHCEDQECRTPIAAQRTALGARLCIACASAEEARGAHMAAWRRR